MRSKRAHVLLACCAVLAALLLGANAYFAKEGSFPRQSQAAQSIPAGESPAAAEPERGVRVTGRGVPLDFADLAERAGRAVVYFNTVKTVGGGAEGLPPGFEGTPFGDMLQRFFGGPFRPQPREQKSLGSGFIISADGLIVTNNHVIDKADKITIKLVGSETLFDAKLVGQDPETDLALLKIDAGNGLPVLEFADSDKARVGEWVVAMGYPLGMGLTVTAGIIGGKGRVIGAGPFDDFIQTDASINFGNSGGPLIGMDGRVVGINTAIVAQGQGIGFAIPSNLAARIIEQLKQGKKVRRGWMGVAIQDVDDNAARALGLPEAKGALVTNVFKGEPADRAGVRVGDVILRVNGEPADDTRTLLHKIASLKPGDAARLSIWRKGREVSLVLTLEERGTKALADAEAEEPPQRGLKPGPAGELGLSLRALKPAEAQDLGLERGLLVTGVQPGSPAAREGLLPGDLILEANQQPVSTPAELSKIVNFDARRKGAVMILVKRQNMNRFVTIPLPRKQ